MAAYVAGNFGHQEYSGHSTPTRLILKEELRKNWYIYQSADGMIFRPYPVFDSNGNCCPPIGDTDPQTEVGILPDAFAALKVATFAGTGKNLEFIDLCTDIDKYNVEHVEYLKTPYEFLVASLRKMSPTKSNPQKTGDGFPTPRLLREITKFSIPTSANCILFRGAMLQQQTGKPINAKAAQEGVLWSTVICIRHKGAIDRFLELFKQRLDVTRDLSADNTVMNSMFRANGCTFRVQAVRDAVNPGGREGTKYTMVQEFDQTYIQRFSNAFKTAPDDMNYWNAIRQSFGPYQSIGDIFNLMTVEEMVQVLKDNYPISWIWYALKDSPYADLVTPDERNQAMRDKEMAGRFGMESMSVQTPPQQSYPSQPAGVGGYTPPPVNDNAQNYYAPKNEGLQKPSWGSPGYGNNADGVPAVAPYPAPPSYVTAPQPQEQKVPTPPPSDDALQRLKEKYGNNAAGSGN